MNIIQFKTDLDEPVSGCSQIRNRHIQHFEVQSNAVKNTTLDILEFLQYSFRLVRSAYREHFYFCKIVYAKNALFLLEARYFCSETSTDGY